MVSSVVPRSRGRSSKLQRSARRTARARTALRHEFVAAASGSSSTEIIPSASAKKIARAEPPDQWRHVSREVKSHRRIPARARDEDALSGQRLAVPCGGWGNCPLDSERLRFWHAGARQLICPESLPEFKPFE